MLRFPVYIGSVPSFWFEGNTLEELMDSLFSKQHIPIPSDKLVSLHSQLILHSKATVAYWLHTPSDSFITVDRVVLTAENTQQKYRCAIDNHYATTKLPQGQNNPLHDIYSAVGTGNYCRKPITEFLLHQLQKALEIHFKT